jgi:hypothetical protein
MMLVQSRNQAARQNLPPQNFTSFYNIRSLLAHSACFSKRGRSTGIFVNNLARCKKQWNVEVD